MQRSIVSALAAATLLLMAACGQPTSSTQPADEIAAAAGGSALAPTAHLGSTATAAPLPPASARPEPAIEKFIALARRDLAGRLRIAAEQITALDTAAITWPDAALGCPQPGAVYPRGRVPGFRITLEAQSQLYRYHTDRVGQIVLCPSADPDASDLPRDPIPGGGPAIGPPRR
jgi:hypothetical protein